MSESKRILYITAFPPGRFSAGEKFSRNLLDNLSVSNNIDLVYFRYRNDPYFDLTGDNIRVVKVFKNSLLIKVVNALMMPILFPLFTVRFNFYRLLVIRKLLRTNSFDLVVCDFSQTFLYSKFLGKIPRVLICHDVIAQRYGRIYLGILSLPARISEKFLLKGRLTRLFCLSRKDSELIKNNYKLNAIQTNIFLDEPVIKAAPSILMPRFVFFGNWKRADNYEGLAWFIKEVYPGLPATFRAAVIGGGLPGKIMREIESLDRMEYLGFMENPYQYIADSTALISPLFSGAGIKVKVLESFACGTKVIGTAVALEGIPEDFGEYMTSADSSAQFIEAISTFRSTLDEKSTLKNKFIASYSNSEIVNWINDYGKVAGEDIINQNRTI